MPTGDPLSYAVDAEKNLEALATELARMGADDQTVKAVSQMADVVRTIVKVLGKGQAQTADAAPPVEEPAPRNLDEASGALQADMQRSAQER